MKHPQIKLIVEHAHSRVNGDGNCYWFSTVTSTVTGKNVRFRTPHSSNSESMALQAGPFEWSDIKCCAAQELPIRKFWAVEKGIEFTNNCNDKDIIIRIKELMT